MYQVIASHLARRGLQLAQEQHARAAVQNGTVQQETVSEVPASPLLMPLLIITFILFIIIAIAMEYAVRYVVGNLAIIEHAATDGSEPGQKAERDALLHSSAEDNDADDKADGKVDDVEVESDVRSGTPMAAGEPITRTVLSTIKHLRRRGGFWSLFRGFRTFTVYCLISLVVSIPLGLGFMFIPFAGNIIGDLLATMYTCGLHCSVTHAIISTYTRKKGASLQKKKTGLARFVPGAWSPHLILPSIRFILAVSICIYGNLLGAMGVQKLVQYLLPNHKGTAFAVALALVVSIAVLSIFFLVIPTFIALVRLEASLLPDGYDVIVPFDRTFGGRVNAEADLTRWNYVRHNLFLGGAYKSFDREAYFRVSRVYVKFFLLSVLLWVLYVAVTLVQLHGLFGWKKFQDTMAAVVTELSNDSG